MYYTREEAIEKVLEIKNRIGHMPTQLDYEECEDIAKLEDLMTALDAASYAAINITVLRELRRREGRQVYIAQDYDRRSWHERGFTINPEHVNGEYEQQASSKDVNRQNVAIEAPKKERKSMGRVNKWTEVDIAKAVMHFYERYGRLPTGEDFNSNGAFKTMGEATPSNWTIYKTLGRHNTEWLDACRAILGNTPVESDASAEEVEELEEPEEAEGSEELEEVVEDEVTPPTEAPNLEEIDDQSDIIDDNIKSFIDAATQVIKMVSEKIPSEICESATITHCKVEISTKIDNVVNLCFIAESRDQQ